MVDLSRLPVIPIASLPGVRAWISECRPYRLPEGCPENA